MQIACGIIGFGEAGRVFGRALSDAGCNVSAFDIQQNEVAKHTEFTAAAKNAGVSLVDAAREAALNKSLVLSTVTADQTINAARSVANAIPESSIYLDLNSTSSDIKISAAKLIEGADAHYVDGVAMDTVANFGAKVPMLASGVAANEVSEKLNALGFNMRPVSDELGQASTIKMLRSVVVKGLEALLAEATLGAERAGVTSELFSSLAHTYPGIDWPKETSYHLCRMALHGKRRAAELRASARTLMALGVDPFIANAIVQRQQWSADLNLKEMVADKDFLTVAEYAAAVEGFEQRYKEEVKNDT